VTDSARIDTRFGSFAVERDRVVVVPAGLPGFEHCRRFVIITAPVLDPLTCLQGLDDSRPTFLAVDPRLVVPDYHVDLADADRRRLGARDGAPLVWLAVVRLESDAAIVNLRAPVVVNPELMLGMQLVPAESPYAIDTRLALD